MNKSIYPCLWHDGHALEAAKFYSSVFKNAAVTTDTPMVVNYELCGKKFMGLNGGPMFRINPSISMFVLFETIEETNAAWEKLLDGGQVLMPIDKYFWSERYGWVQDKFGMSWQLSVVSGKGDVPGIIPSLLFTVNQFGRAEEAISLYIGIFPGSSITELIKYPAEDNNAGKIMYSSFKLNGYDMIAIDGPGEHAYTFSEGLSLVVECDTQEEIDHYWYKLTAGGGAESMCGWLKDRFGVSWQIVPTVLGKLMADPERSGRVMQAFMKMKKFNIEQLLSA